MRVGRGDSARGTRATPPGQVGGDTWEACRDTCDTCVLCKGHVYVVETHRGHARDASGARVGCGTRRGRAGHVRCTCGGCVGCMGTQGTRMRRGDVGCTHGGCGHTQRTFMGYSGGMCGMWERTVETRRTCQGCTWWVHGDTQDAGTHTGDKQGTCWEHMWGLAWDTEGTCGRGETQDRLRTHRMHRRDIGMCWAQVGESAQQARGTQDGTDAQGTRESRETRRGPAREHSEDRTLEDTLHTQGTDRGHSWNTKDPGREK